MNRRTLFLAVPQALSLFGVAMAIAGIVRYSRPEHAGAVGATATGLFVIYLAWLIVEWRITFRHIGGEPSEGWTFYPYALGRAGVGVGAAVGPLPWSGWSPLLLLPVVLFLAGIAERQVAIGTLGRFYSHHVVRQDDHSVVTHGVYRLVRHPAYVGMLLANVGFTGFFLNPFTVVSLLVLVFGVVARIRVEERVLWTIPAYPQYAHGRARLLPGVW
ncbi:methyltransferase family protein [Nocardia sp. NPDC051570]|uniref:methyltransferase family protein n=1 Tax=Nocardia sp. NPDC051570 TaxID=3364324 RepID=UPI0037998DE5